MIDTALELLQSELNTFLKGKLRSDSAVVEIGGVLDLASQPAPAPVLRLTLVRIEEERVLKAQLASHRRTDGQIEQVEPELKLNLYLLVSGYLSPYAQGLRHLSAVIGFFQAKPVFHAGNAPGLDPAIEKLMVELHSPTFDELNQLFSMLSAGYRPAVLYKVRLVVIQDSAPAGVRPPVLSVGSEGVRV